jgi:hypothetical protein
MTELRVARSSASAVHLGERNVIIDKLISYVIASQT